MVGDKSNTNYSVITEMGHPHCIFVRSYNKFSVSGMEFKMRDEVEGVLMSQITEGFLMKSDMVNLHFGKISRFQW